MYSAREVEVSRGAILGIVKHEQVHTQIGRVSTCPDREVSSETKMLTTPEDRDLDYDDLVDVPTKTEYSATPR